MPRTQVKLTALVTIRIPIQDIGGWTQKHSHSRKHKITFLLRDVMGVQVALWTLDTIHNTPHNTVRINLQMPSRTLYRSIVFIDKWLLFQDHRMHSSLSNHRSTPVVFSSRRHAQIQAPLALHPNTVSTDSSINQPHKKLFEARWVSFFCLWIFARDKHDTNHSSLNIFRHHPTEKTQRQVPFIGIFSFNSWLLMSNKTINVDERSDWNDLHCNYAPLCPRPLENFNNVRWSEKQLQKKRIRRARQISSRMRPSKLLLELTRCSTGLMGFSWNNDRQIRSWACASNFIVAAPPWL